MRFAHTSCLSQDNAFSGTVPSDLWDLPLLNTLHMSVNPKLQGALSLQNIHQDETRETGLQISVGYTEIKLMDMVGTLVASCCGSGSSGTCVESGDAP